MSGVSVEPVVRDGFSLAVDGGPAEGAIRVRFSGTADLETTASLAAFLTRLHDEVIRTAARTVVFDFTALEFMNSSCFKCFVTWIAGLDKPARASLSIRFLSNAGHVWQRRSLDALHRFAPDLVTVEP
jgi:hypothetical protein